MRLERWVIDLTTGECSCEVRCAVTSLPPQLASASDLLQLWRGHWTIENNLHWVRDVLFGEDASRVRTRHGPQILAVCRNTVLSLLRLVGYSQIASAREHFAARPSQPSTWSPFQLTVGENESALRGMMREKTNCCRT
jgi:hypothetical protein